MFQHPCPAAGCAAARLDRLWLQAEHRAGALAACWLDRSVAAAFGRWGGDSLELYLELGRAALRNAPVGVAGAGIEGVGARGQKGSRAGPQEHGATTGPHYAVRPSARARFGGGGGGGPAGHMSAAQSSSGALYSHTRISTLWCNATAHGRK